MNTIEIGTRLEGYLRQHWPGRPDLRVESVQRIPGGASRQTFRIVIRHGRKLTEDSESLILRIDPDSSLIDTERALEYRTYAAVYGTEIPVPEPLLLEEDPEYLGNAFSLMAEIPGCDTSPVRFAEPEFAPLRAKTGEQKWQILGKLTALETDQLGLYTFMDLPQPGQCASQQLDYWAGVIEQDALHPQPLAQAAIRWLHKNPPAPPGKIVLVHGDYRSGNFLYDPQGDIQGILDWEMAHLGDPLEDLAWSLDPLWSWPDPVLAGGLLPREEAIRIWEKSSALSVDPEDFHWWQIFTSLKGLAIWISSAEEFATGSSKEPLLAVAGWVMADRQNQILVDRLSPLSRGRFPFARPAPAEKKESKA